MPQVNLKTRFSAGKLAIPAEISQAEISQAVVNMLSLAVQFPFRPLPCEPEEALAYVHSLFPDYAHDQALDDIDN